MLLLSVAGFKLQSILTNDVNKRMHKICFKKCFYEKKLNTRLHMHQNLYLPIIDSDNGF